MDEFTHRLSSRGTEAPQLRYCHYSCCMLKRLRLTTPLFPPPRSLLQVFPTPKMRPCSSSILYSVCFFFFLFFVGRGWVGGGGYSSVCWSVFYRFSSRHIHLFVCCLNFSQECRARQSVCLFPASIVTTDHRLVVTLLINNREEKKRKPLCCTFFLGHQKARRSYRERDTEMDRERKSRFFLRESERDNYRNRERERKREKNERCIVMSFFFKMK